MTGYQESHELFSSTFQVSSADSAKDGAGWVWSLGTFPPYYI